jgi:hypothetical protein
VTTSLSASFPPLGIFGVSELGGQELIIIQQFQSPVTSEPREPAKNTIYVSPHWGGRRVWSAGFGARLLDPPEASGRDSSADSFLGATRPSRQILGWEDKTSPHRQA